MKMKKQKFIKKDNIHFIKKCLFDFSVFDFNVLKF